VAINIKTIIVSGIEIIVVLALLYPILIEPWHLSWGAIKEEQKMDLPGDDLSPDPNIRSTRAITINAPVEDVWPWLVQIGQGRGGLYSYDWLENIAGCDMRSADRIHPEWQDTKPGDFVRFGKPDSNYPKVPVYAVEPNKVLILGGITDAKTGRDLKPGEPKPEQYYGSTWVFYLKKIDDTHTRLIARSLYSYSPGIGNTIMWRVITEPLHFIMERKMLFGIKERAESMQHSSTAQR
jgi:hypothetical protein